MSELPWTLHAPLPLLALLQLVPLAGALAVHALRETRLAVPLGRACALVTLGLAVLLVVAHDPALAALQFAERVPGIGYHAAADGFTALFVLASAVIGVLLSLYGLSRELMSRGALQAVLLCAQAALMTMLTTLNLLWFAAASAVELLLVARLLARWSVAPESDQALARFGQYQGFGWVLFVAGCVVLGWGHADAMGGTWSFDLTELVLTPPQGKFQTAAFYLLFYGLAVRTPLFPLHGWLPNTAQHGMIAIAPTLLIGIKVGIYGMARFILPLTPDAVAAWQPWVVAFAGTGVFFTAALALLQTNLRRLLAFAVVSHTSLIVIGLFTLHPLGIQGSLLLALNFGLAVTVMLLMVALVWRRTGTTELAELGGLFERIPFIAVAFFLGGLSIVGMPGTPGFDAAHLVLEASIEQFGALPTVATALGNVAAAGFLLWAFQRAFLTPRGAGGASVERVQAMEYVLGGAALAALLFAGFFPEPWLALTDASARALAARFTGGGLP